MALYHGSHNNLVNRWTAKQRESPTLATPAALVATNFVRLRQADAEPTKTHSESGFSGLVLTSETQFPSSFP